MNELVVALISALAPVFALVGRKVLRRLDTIIDTFDGMQTKIDSVHLNQKTLAVRVGVIEAKAATVEASVAELGKEFKPNGGSSIRDTLDELREKLLILDGRHRARFAGDGLATYECRADGECIEVSPALAELFGLPQTHILGRGWLAAVETAEERIRVWANWEAAVKAEIPYEDVYTVARPDGSRKLVRTYVRCTRGSDGKVLCYHGVVTVVGEPPVMGS